MVSNQQGHARQNGVGPKTQATKLPEINRASLDGIQRLEKCKRTNIWSWKRSVQGALIPLKLEDAIDNKVPRPSENDPNYERWRSWSTVVRCWLLNQLSPSIIENLELFSKHLEVELDLEDRLPRYADDLRPLIANAFMAGEEREKSNAAVAIRTIRRERFEPADEFIQEWRKWILKIWTLRMDIDTHIATKLMLLDLRYEMPMTVNSLEDQIGSYGSVPDDRFLGICDEIIAKSKKTPNESTLI